MHKLKSNKPLFYILFCQILILLLAVGNFLICRANLYSTTFLPTELEMTGDFINGEHLTVSNENCGAGVAAFTAPFTLSRGSYIVYINYNTNTPGNTLSAVSASLAPHALRSAPATLSPNVKTAVLTLDLGRKTDDVVLNMYFQGQGYLEVLGISLHQTTDSAKQDFVYALGLCLVLFLGYFIYSCNLQKRQIVFSLSMIILFASYPLFLDYMIVGHDLPFHLLRIEGIKTGLEQGIFPVKIHPVWAYDYGYATGVFYGDALLYFPALLRLFGMSVQSAYQCFVFAVNTATALISYFCFKKLFSSEKLGLLGSMLYTLSLYRLLNVYTRAAVGEYCAMIFLPMVFLGLYQIFTQAEKKGWWKLAILPALGLTGIIQSHILSCEMVAVFIFLTCIVFFKRLLKPRVFVSLCITAGLTLLLSAGFLVPFIDYYLTEEFIINSSEWSTSSVQSMGLFLTQIFSIFPDGVGGTWATSAGTANEFDPGIGLPLIIGFFLYIYYLFTASKEEKKDKRFGLSLLSFLYGAAALLLCTYFFPYDALAESGGVGRAVVSSLQFPWRFLSLGTLFLTICTCISLKQGFEKLTGTLSGSGMAAGLSRTLGVLLICLTTVISTGWYYYTFTTEGNPYRVFETYELPSTQLYSCEYLPAGTVLNDIVENRYAASEGVTITDIQKSGTTLTCRITSGSAGGYAEFPLTLYKGYVAEHVETGESLTILNGRNNALRVEIPEDFAGTLTISFKEPVYWRIAEVVSALTVLLLCGMGIRKYRSPI